MPQEVVEALRDQVGLLQVGCNGQLLYSNPPLYELVPLQLLAVGAPLLAHLSHVPRLRDYIETALSSAGNTPAQVVSVRIGIVERRLLIMPIALPLSVLLVLRDADAAGEFEMDRIDRERMATAGRLAAGVAHEIRNPLATLRGFLQMMSEDEAVCGQLPVGRLQLLLREVDRINHLLQDLLMLTRPTLTVGRTEVGQSLERVLRERADALLARKIRVSTDFAPVPAIRADAECLALVLQKLLDNALDAMDDGGRLGIGCALDGGTMVRMDISDSGLGIPNYLKDRIFDVFYTTKESGAGLGLPICQRLVTEMGGRIRVAAKGFGATFSVFLPVFEEEAP